MITIKNFNNVYQLNICIIIKYKYQYLLRIILLKKTNGFIKSNEQSRCREDYTRRM